MNVFELPFNKYIGLEKATDSEYLLMLQDKKEYQNHLETVHASAQFALAEATSGYFLLNQFQGLTNILPVVRKVEIRYKRPAQGTLFSKATFVDTKEENILAELQTRKRALITVRVLLYDSGKNTIMQSDFEWFVTQRI